MTSRPRWAQLALMMTATLVLALMAVVSSSSHEDDDPPIEVSAGSAGPKRGAVVKMPTGLIAVEIMLGLNDTVRTAWDGEVSVSEGRVAGLEIVRSASGDATVDGGRFKVESKKKKAANKKKKQQELSQPAVIHANLEAPETAVVTVRSENGRFSFRLGDLKRAGPTRFLDGDVSVERREPAVRLTGSGWENDYPVAARAGDGSIWLAYVEYRPEVAHLTKAASKKNFDSLVPTKHGDMIRIRRFDGKTAALRRSM